MFIIATAPALSWIAAIEDIPARLAGTLPGLTKEPALILLLVNLVRLVAGAFMEAPSALILLAPIRAFVGPVLGVDIIQRALSW